MQLRRALVAAAMTLSVLLPACGGGGSTDVTTGLPIGETTTSAAQANTTATTVPIATTTRRVAATPGPPQTPVTGPLTTPPTARPTDPYLPAGVPDQVFPPGTAAYRLLREGQCGPLLRQITLGEAPSAGPWGAGIPASLTALYTAAAEACLSRWTAARASFQRISTQALCKVDPDTGTLDSSGSASSFDTVAACQAQRLRVYRWTEDLLRRHDANPAFVPNFPTPPKA